MTTAGLRMFRRGRGAIAGVLLSLATASAIGTAYSDEVWQGVLKLQLEDERKCQLRTILFVRDLRTSGLGGIEGRVRCLDGREFDFSRQKAHQKFELRLCQPAVC